MSKASKVRWGVMSVAMASLCLCACATSERVAAVVPPANDTVAASIDTTKPIPLIGANVPTEADVDSGMPPAPTPKPNDAALPR